MLGTLLIKEEEFVNFSMVNFFEKVLSRSMNKEEPPMNCTKLGRIVGNLVQLWVQFIPDNGTRVSNSGLKDSYQFDGFSLVLPEE
ncbi:hypothetical protein Tco_0382750 [Tanacetum coccineum]